MPFDFDVDPPEVPLDRAPLVRVLCQVRFSSVPELIEPENERLIARGLSNKYPVRGSAEGLTIPLISGAGPVEPERFRTFEDSAGNWKVTVGSNFVALETTAYGSRKEFLEELYGVLVSIEQVEHSQRVTRIGIRYTDQIEQPEGLVGLVEPSLLGILPELTEPDSTLDNQVVQILLNEGSGSKVQVRSLCLPPGVSFDASLEPSSSRSWVLDIDAYNEASRAFQAQELVDEAEFLARLAYRVFHWSVNDTFRARFGAEQTGGQ